MSSLDGKNFSLSDSMYIPPFGVGGRAGGQENQHILMIDALTVDNNCWCTFSMQQHQILTNLTIIKIWFCFLLFHFTGG